MLMKHHLLFLFFPFIIYSCNDAERSAHPANKDSEQVEIPQKITEGGYRLKFKGFLRHGNEVRETELEFVNRDLLYIETAFHPAAGKYVRRTGSYNTERGYKPDINAVVYVLDDDRPEVERTFLKIDDGSIMLLDSSRQVIDTTPQYRLYPQ
jgi:hypothetical protein